MGTPSKPRLATSYLEGNLLKCVSSKSKFYVVGNVYIIVKNNEGIMCVKGSDGYLDPLNKMLSKFEPYTSKNPKDIKLVNSI